MATTTKPKAAADDREIGQFLSNEAHCLDDRDRWDEWLDLFAADGTYWIPYTKEQASPDDMPSIIYEDRTVLEVRLEKLRHPRSWSQQPPMRTARIVGNVMVAGNDAETGHLIVRSTFQLLAFRRDRYNQLGGHYTHRLNKERGGWKIVQKRVDLISADGIYEDILEIPV